LHIGGVVALMLDPPISSSKIELLRNQKKDINNSALITDVAAAKFIASSTDV
jgi:hypothetical protein